ncbi:MAG: sugar-transfer associated ATP-grasp domain-containing protein [Eubacteriales bacterium]|nr:sugar-transfer associated ATP-grasp domain-containing protein [Eubacteriales bacterium]
MKGEKLCRFIWLHIPMKPWKREYDRFLYARLKSQKNYLRLRNEMQRIYENSPVLQKYSWEKISGDYHKCYVLFGTEPEDYSSFEFVDKSWRDRSHHVTRIRLNYLRTVLNTGNQELLNDKVLFNTHWENYLKRSWCDISKVSKEEFLALFQDKDRLVIKTKTGSGGHGVEVWEAIQKESKEELYARLKEREDGCLVEEYYHQKGFLHELNPSSLNTVRVCTIRNQEKIEVIFAYLRCGIEGAVIDNLHSGGIRFPLDVRNGILHSGQSYSRSHIETHPTSGIRVSGQTIPNWDNVKKLCIEAHEMAPETLNFIGWDVCVSENEILLIEGNACPGFPPTLGPGDNMWKRVRKILNSRS